MLARFKSHPRKFPEHFACGGCPAIHFHKALEITGPIVSEGSTATRSVWLVLIARRIDRFRAHSRSRIDVKTHTCAEYIRNWHTRSPPGIWRARSPFSVPGEKKRGGCGACSKSPPLSSSLHNTRFPRVLLAPSVALFPSLVGPNSPPWRRPLKPALRPAV